MAPPPPGPTTVNPPGRSLPPPTAKTAHTRHTRRNTIAYFPLLSFCFLRLSFWQKPRRLSTFPSKPGGRARRSQLRFSGAARERRFRDKPCEGSARATLSRRSASALAGERAPARNQNTHLRFQETGSRSHTKRRRRSAAAYPFRSVRHRFQTVCGPDTDQKTSAKPAVDAQAHRFWLPVRRWCSENGRDIR